MDAQTAINNLICTYAERIDAGDYGGVADLFTAGRITVEGTDAVRVGREEVLEMYRRTTRIHEDTGTPKTKHLTTNILVDVDDEAGTAQARSYFTVLQATASLALQPIIAGRYYDTFERRDGAWHFVERHMICDLFGDLSQHLFSDVGL